MSNLVVPPLPAILAGSSVSLWRKWFAFWCLSLSQKADIVDLYPALVIEVPTSKETQASGGPPMRVYFDPGVFDTQIPDNVVYRMWGKVIFSDGLYPRQWTVPEGDLKQRYFEKLSDQNYAILAYKYRYLVRPERFAFELDFRTSLLNTATESDLRSFYHEPGQLTSDEIVRL